LKISKSAGSLPAMIVALILASAFTVPASAAAKVPAKVTGVKAVKPITDTMISISWKKAKNAKQYQVNYKKANAKKWIALKKTKALKITKKGLKKNTKYKFRVRGINGRKKGKFSKVITKKTSAYDWWEWDCESNNDGRTHTRTYYCDDCWDMYSVKEPCTWEHLDCAWKTYGKNGHYHIYECRYCYGDKEKFEDCSWERSYRNYNDWDGKKHQIKTDYDCTKCDNSKTVTTYKKHTFKWVRDGSIFWYKCKYCDNEPKFNGEELMDWNDSDNVTVRKKKTYKYYMDYYHKTRNKVKSIKYSKKKICSAKRKGKSIIIKGKKKGKCRVTVKMRSGAKYVFNVKVS